MPGAADDGYRGPVIRWVVAASLAALAGCSSAGSPAGPSTAAGAGACRLTGEQVSDIVGFTVKTGVGTQGDQDCFYNSADGSRSVVISVRHVAGGESRIARNIEKEFKDVAPISGTPGAYSVPHLSEVLLFTGAEQIIVICRHLDAMKELALAKAVAG